MQYIREQSKSPNKKLLTILIILFALTGYGMVVFAVPPIGGYTPGSTLDPQCAPGDPDCSVSFDVLTFDSPLVKTGNTISIPAASAGIDGYLSASDWNRFDGKQDSFGSGTSLQYLRGDNTWQTLDSSIVPENGNLYWTNNRFDTRLVATTSIPNLQTVGTISSGVWHGSQITDAYVSDSITVSNYIPLSQKGVANGVATLDGAGKILSSQLSSFSLSDTFVVNSEAEMLNLLTAELGDVAIRLDENKSYILTTNDPTNVANWQQIITPLDFVLSVNGQYGAVNLTTTDIAEGLNLYYTDSRVDDYLNTVKGVANGVASLDANGKIPTNQLGSIILNETHVITDIPAMLALIGVTNGDLAVVTSTSQTYVLADDNNPSNINSWVEIVNGSPVTSVNGQVGTVNLTTTNISEGSNQYFTNTRARSAFSATGPLSYNAGTGVFGITQANNIHNGFLSAVDWNTFNGKQSALTFGTVTANNNPEITITGGAGAVIGGGMDITIPDASDTVRGLVTTGSQNFAGVKNFADGLGVGDVSPSELFSVGLGGLFQVDTNGDIVKIKNINYTWPSTQGAADSVLINDGSGNLSWSSNGVTSLNGLTDATQTFTTSTDGSDFSISSLNGVHTFNFPTASATARGALSATKYTEFNNKPIVDTTYNNIYIGSISAGSVINGAGGGINNIVMGYQSGDTLSTGNNNTLLGYQSGKNITTGVSHAFFAGYQAGLNATGATTSNFIGRSAGSGATSASFANFFGRSAGLNATGAQYGVFIGDNAGNTASSASNAIFLGQNAGYQATSASYSNFIGTTSGYQASGATTANFIGYGAGAGATNASYSNFLGRLAGNAASSATYSNFFGFQAGYNATNAANSIFIGKNAGLNDLVNNTVSGSSIAIGDSAGTGGFSNSIALGASAVNTLANQFLIGSSYTNFNVRGINYVWPATQAGGSGYVLNNDGSGNLSWGIGLTIGGSNTQLQYNNNGNLGGITGITYDGANFDARDNVFRIVDNSDTTKRAVFEVSGIDTGTTRTYTFPNTAGTLALTSDLIGILKNNIGISGGTTIIGDTTSGGNLTLSSTSHATKGKILFGTSAYDEVNNRLGIGIGSPTAQLHLSAGTATAGSAPLKFTAGTNLTTAEAGAVEYNGSELLFTPTGTLRSGVMMIDFTNRNMYSPTLKGGTALTSGSRNFLSGYLAGQNLTVGSDNVMIGHNAGYASSNSISNTIMIGQVAGGVSTGVDFGVFLGNRAGYNASGAYGAIFLGQSAGINSGNSGYSIFLGNGAGQDSGNNGGSILLGYQAGRNSGGSTGSIMLGSQAGWFAPNATNSIFLGAYAGRGSSGAADSIFLGQNAGYNPTTGISGIGNIFIGYNAGNNHTSGAKNVLIGYDLDTQLPTDTGQLSIQNIIFGIGNTGTGTTISSGNIGIGVIPSSYRFQVSNTATSGIVASFGNSDGTCTLDPGDVSGWSCPSDINLKKNITTLENGSLEHILALRPVTYQFINESDTANLSTGLIAQEVQTVFPRLVKTQTDGTLALNYGGLTPYMISAIQEMNFKITTINNMDTPNSWRDALIAWFGNAVNGIQKFFAKEVYTETLCVGQTCLNETQVQQLLQVIGSQGSTSPIQDSASSPDSENESGDTNTDTGNTDNINETELPSNTGAEENDIGSNITNTQTDNNIGSGADDIQIQENAIGSNTENNAVGLPGDSGSSGENIDTNIPVI